MDYDNVNNHDNHDNQGNVDIAATVPARPATLSVVCLTSRSNNGGASEREGKVDEDKDENEKENTMKKKKKKKEEKEKPKRGSPGTKGRWLSWYFKKQLPRSVKIVS